MPTEFTLTRAQGRQVDKMAVERFGIPSLILMENAGRGCAEFLVRQELDRSRPVCILSGKGNNGGDGFVIARQLLVRGIPVQVVTCHEPESFSPDAAVNFEILQRLEVPCQLVSLPRDQAQLEAYLHDSSCVVDALLGTGVSGAARAPEADIIAAVNRSERPVLAVDVPSGMDCDAIDQSSIVVQARWTTTMVAWKPAFHHAAGKAAAGEVEVVDIGIPLTTVKAVVSEMAR